MLGSLRSRLALAVVKRRLPKIMAADTVAELPDGLHVAIVGSGSPLPDPKRGNPCVAVIAAGRVYIVDAGEGASETLNRMGIVPSGIESVLLTHYHSDHIGGIGSVNLQRWVAEGETEPMRVIGPPGLARVIAGFNEAYALDGTYRTAHHGSEIAPPSGSTMVADEFSFAPGEQFRTVISDGGLEVTAFVVDHSPVEPVVGYRFDYAGRSAMISGDTVPTSALVDAAAGADLLVHDGLSIELLKLVEDAAGAAGLTSRQQILADITDYHATPLRPPMLLGRLASAPWRSRTSFRRSLSGGWRSRSSATPGSASGPLWLASDGDLYRLPAHARPSSAPACFVSSRGESREGPEAVQTPARVNVRCVTPLGEEVASTS